MTRTTHEGTPVRTSSTKVPTSGLYEGGARPTPDRRRSCARTRRAWVHGWWTRRLPALLLGALLALVATAPAASAAGLDDVLPSDPVVRLLALAGAAGLLLLLLGALGLWLTRRRSSPSRRS